MKSPNAEPGPEPKRLGASNNKKKKEKESASKSKTDSTLPSDFIRDIIDEDLRMNKYEGRVHTRFPPEPNG
ncbi:MAG: hypothetical protein KAW52_07975, partial [candidate division Zixibacteria bacterium]|nr:hypothetical protein [candidate division Zixibacteria bacterium]